LQNVVIQILYVTSVISYLIHIHTHTYIQVINCWQEEMFGTKALRHSDSADLYKFFLFELDLTYSIKKFGWISTGRISSNLLSINFEYWPPSETLVEVLVTNY